MNGCEILSVYDEQADRVWAEVGSLCECLDLRASDQVRKLTEGEAYQGLTIELDIRFDYNYRPGESRGQTRKMWFINLRRLRPSLRSTSCSPASCCSTVSDHPNSLLGEAL